jgi:NAD(P)-dependent dehydrogenase (short-subunit alcohol dehydrogenase family)
MHAALNRRLTAFILGASSDIGGDLALRYAEDGADVIGTYRGPNSPARLAEHPRIRLLCCDVSLPTEVDRLVEAYSRLDEPWDVFVSAVGTMEPIGPFLSTDFDAWQQSVTINSLAQLRVLHGLSPYRRNSGTAHVVFFAGGGTNGPFANYSAYCASKIFLIKMCELISDENPDINAFILGPGFVATKIHNQTFAHADAAGINLSKTMRFLETSTSNRSLADIYECINWCINSGAAISAGRNFSVVHDGWRMGGEELTSMLQLDANKFKLRRYAND